MNPITSISSLSGDLLIAVIGLLVFVEETGIPIPFAPGDLLLMTAGLAIASDTVEPVPMVGALLLATILGAMTGREVFAAVGRSAVLKTADVLRFRPALERATRLLQRGGAPAVFAGRLIPGLRISTTQAAGISRMTRTTFALGLIPSVFVYVAIFVGLGALIGQPAVRLFHRAEHRFFVIVVLLLAAAAVILSVRWLARRGALSALEPIVLGVRRQFADSLDALIFRGSRDDANWRLYPLARRLWAALVDVGVVFAAAVFILTAASGIDKSEIVLDPQGLLLVAAVALVYRVPYEAMTGQTIGKLLMGIAVYGPDSGVPGWSRAATRNLIGVLVFLWPVDAILLLTTARRQRLCDLTTKSTVRRVAH